MGYLDLIYSNCESAWYPLYYYGDKSLYMHLRISAGGLIFEINTCVNLKTVSLTHDQLVTLVWMERDRTCARYIRERDRYPSI